jgi:hypothetical protein
MERDEIDRLREKVARLQTQVLRLKNKVARQQGKLAEKDKQIAELERRLEQLSKTGSNPLPVRVLPPFVKLNVPRRRGRRGRAIGHVAALRAMPKIDRHEQVPLPKDRFSQSICPECRCPLTRLRRHKRIVEDLIPSAVEAICYHTASGYCPRCRRRVESRASQQPPAANVPHGQLGINALATAAILRVRHRLPFRQISQLLLEMPGLHVSPAAIVKQIKRLSRWLDGKYQQLIARMRNSPHVHVDETGWRIDGKNAWLWAFTDPTFTLYHVDGSRGSKVPTKLLGKKFNGTVICDFYKGYGKAPGVKQRCLVHLMHDVKHTAEQWRSFADTPLARRLMRWCRDALLLKKQWDQLPDAQYDLEASRLQHRLDRLIKMKHENGHAQRLHKRLRCHRGELTRFLWERDLAGTNNAAERAIRPAVILRKITGGNRSLDGARAWAKLASLVRTADQQGLGVYEATKKLVTDYWARER